MTVYKNLVHDGLTQFAMSAPEQVALWGGHTDEQSSFVEAYEALFDDSGLGDSLRRGPVYGPEIDLALRQLRAALDAVNEETHLEILTESAALAEIRSIAARLLRIIGDEQ